MCIFFQSKISLIFIERESSLQSFRVKFPWNLKQTRYKLVRRPPRRSVLHANNLDYYRTNLLFDPNRRCHNAFTFSYLISITIFFSKCQKNVFEFLPLKTTNFCSIAIFDFWKDTRFLFGLTCADTSSAILKKDKYAKSWNELSLGGDWFGGFLIDWPSQRARDQFSLLHLEKKQNRFREPPSMHLLMIKNLLFMGWLGEQRLRNLTRLHRTRTPQNLNSRQFLRTLIGNSESSRITKIYMHIQKNYT